MLKAIFYARFHPERGPDILHQYPAGSIGRSNTSANLSSSLNLAEFELSSSLRASTSAFSLIPFSSISGYVIPPHELSNRSLAICVQGFRVLGFPISIEGEGYERNRFVCNICFVVEDSEEKECWEGVVRKMARFMRSLEVEGDGGVLWREEKEVDARLETGEDEAEGLIGRVLREAFEQLNAYGECCVRVSATQVLNLGTGKTICTGEQQTKPKKARAWDVPLLTRALPETHGWTWYLVLEHIYPYIDGVNHIKSIAQQADVDLKLVKKAVRELVLHDHAVVLDIFHFQAVYAPTSDFALFVEDVQLIDECREYVAAKPQDSVFARNLEKDTVEELPSRATIIDLYSILKPGLSVLDFSLAHQSLLANIDIRRFITYGLLKSFLVRKHKYALALDPPEINHIPQSNSTDLDKAWRAAALSSGWATPPAEGAGILAERMMSEDGRRRMEDARLGRFLDGRCCLDRVCVEMGMGEGRVVERARSGRFGEVVFFYR